MTAAKLPLEHSTVDFFSTRIHCNTMFVPFSCAFDDSTLPLTLQRRWWTLATEMEVEAIGQERSAGNHARSLASSRWIPIIQRYRRRREKFSSPDFPGADHFEWFSNAFVRHSFERNRAKISRLFESNESNSCRVQSRRSVHHQVVIFIRIRLHLSRRLLYSGSEDSWFYIWRTEPSNTTNTSGTSSVNALLARNQRRYFGRAFERIRGEHTTVRSNPHEQSMSFFNSTQYDGHLGYLCT